MKKGDLKPGRQRNFDPAIAYDLISTFPNGNFTYQQLADKLSELLDREITANAVSKALRKNGFILPKAPGKFKTNKKAVDP